MAGTKKKKVTKNTKARRSASFSPPELKLTRRFLASSFGKVLTGMAIGALVLTFEILIAHNNLHLLLLMIGISLLLVMVAFWLYLLLRRAVRHDA